MLFHLMPVRQASRYEWNVRALQLAGAAVTSRERPDGFDRCLRFRLDAVTKSPGACACATICDGCETVWQSAELPRPVQVRRHPTWSQELTRTRCRLRAP